MNHYTNHQQEVQNKRQQILKHNTIYIWRLKEVITQDATNKQKEGWQLKKINAPKIKQEKTTTQKKWHKNKKQLQNTELDIIKNKKINEK